MLLCETMMTSTVNYYNITQNGKLTKDNDRKLLIAETVLKVWYAGKVPDHLVKEDTAKIDTSVLIQKLVKLLCRSLKK